MGTGPTKAETDLWTTLYMVQGNIFRSIDLELKSQGLPSQKWYDVLWVLECAQDNGLRAKQLERKVLFEQSNLSRVLKRMISEGLIEETVCIRDGRAKILKITDKGRVQRKQIWEVYGPLIHKHMKKLAAKGDATQISAALRSLIGLDENPWMSD